MEEFYSRSNLISATDLVELSQRSDRAGYLHLACHLMLISFGCFLVWRFQGTGWLIPAWMFYGIVLVFLFAPLHECIHNTAFRTRSVNCIVASVVGFLILLPANYFREFHFQHHRYTNNPALDPELQSQKPSTKLQYYWAMTGISSYWWPQLRTLCQHSLGTVDESFIVQKLHKKIITEARIHVLLYAVIAIVSVATDSWAAFLYWIVPVMIGMVALRVFLLAEHTGCELTEDMRNNTRTMLTNSAVRLIVWNMNYHCEHHLFPSVPFHKLPRLHNHLTKSVFVVSSGYFDFHNRFRRSL